MLLIELCDRHYKCPKCPGLSCGVGPTHTVGPGLSCGVDPTHIAVGEALHMSMPLNCGLGPTHDQGPGLSSGRGSTNAQGPG